MKMTASGKVVGDLVEGTLYKRGKQVVLFRNYDGFAIPEKIAKDPRVESVAIEYNGAVYSASIERWLTYGIRYHKEPYEPQIILRRKDMSSHLYNQEVLL